MKADENMKAGSKRKRSAPKAKRPRKPAKPPVQEPTPARSKADTSTLVLSKEELDRLKKHPNMFNHSMGWLQAIVRRPDEALPGKDAQDFAYDAFIGFIPDGPGEIMLCQQMIAAHEMAMFMLSRCKRADTVPFMQECGNLGIKMMGTYERLFQTLMKARKPQQTVRVEHVTINGGQTVVGNVSQPQALEKPETADQLALESTALLAIDRA